MGLTCKDSSPSRLRWLRKRRPVFIISLALHGSVGVGKGGEERGREGVGVVGRREGERGRRGGREERGRWGEGMVERRERESTKGG